MDSKPEVKWVETMSRRVAMLALTTRNVSTEKENLAHTLLTHFASRLDSLAFLLKEMQRDAELRHADYKKLENGKLDDQVEAMESFLELFSDKCNLYLLSSCPQIVKQLQVSSKTLSEALDSVMDNAGCPAMKLRIAQVKEAFESSTPKLDAKQHSILDSLEPEMLDCVLSDTSRCSKLVQQIAESFELSLDSDQFAKELSKLRNEKNSEENVKGKAQGLYLEQFMNLLEKGVMGRSQPNDDQGALQVPLMREITMRSTPLTPLDSFICPITREVMRDPVQIDSNHTFEREAVERWFAEGHTRCPYAGEELKNTKMKSNIALRQSIAEWKDRNFAIRIKDADGNLRSESLEDKAKGVQELQRICEECKMNKYTIASRGLLPLLVRLCEVKNFELRAKTFAALRTLAEDNEENQEIMVKEGIIDMLVRCLARRHEESVQAVLLLRLLSARPKLAQEISSAHGALLLLVTLLGTPDAEMAANVKQILENLPPSDENIVIMAEANLMKPLVTRLVEGSPSSKLLMAKTLAQLEMPDVSKKQTATQESIAALLTMAQSTNEEEKVTAVEALKNLTTVRDVCALVSHTMPSGAKVLVPLLRSPQTTMAVRVSASHVMANVMTRLGDAWEPREAKAEQIDELICNFLSLYFPPAAQTHVLRGLLGLANGKDTGMIAKTKLMERDALTLVAPLMKPDLEVRKYAVQIIAALSDNWGKEAAAVLMRDPTENFTNILAILKGKETRGEPDKISAMTILASMPLDDENITAALLQLDCIPLLVKNLTNRQAGMQEAAAGALLRFTVQKDLQLKLAEQNVLQRFVALLDSNRSLTQERAARALTNFSRSSSKMSTPVVPQGLLPYFTCFSPKVDKCSIHKGICKVETSFCLKEADAVPALLAVMKDGEPNAAEAALEAILTLVDGDVVSSEPGVQLIAKFKGIPMMMNVLNKGTTASQEMAVSLCEKIFKIAEYRQQFGSILQMHIITVAQKGSQKARQIAGRVLRQLDLLHSQSHYFSQSVPSTT